jgi:hypothetical protein
MRRASAGTSETNWRDTAVWFGAPGACALAHLCIAILTRLLQRNGGVNDEFWLPLRG